MFLFKKIVSKFLFPLPLCFLLALISLYLLWFSKKQKVGKVLATIGFGLIFLLSNNFVASHILFPLENRFPMYEAEALDKPALKYIVVLGGGHVTNPTLPVTSQLNEPVIVRLVEGIRIHRQNPGTKLILSGGNGSVSHDPNPNAKLLADLAVDLGVDKGKILLELESKDTKDEARLIKPMVGEAPFALVTSASHMPRAMALFQKAGMNPIAAPTNHLVKNIHGSAFSTWFPEARHLRKSERTVYESLGLLWAKLRDQI